MGFSRTPALELKGNRVSMSDTAECKVLLDVQVQGMEQIFQQSISAGLLQIKYRIM